MAKAVLTTKVDPSYDDLPEERYHFPRTYLNAVRQSLRDWIVYYEPRRVSADLSSSGGRQSYFATAWGAGTIQSCRTTLWSMILQPSSRSARFHSILHHSA